VSDGAVASRGQRWRAVAGGSEQWLAEEVRGPL